MIEWINIVIIAKLHNIKLNLLESYAGVIIILNHISDDDGYCMYMKSCKMCVSCRKIRYYKQKNKKKIN